MAVSKSRLFFALLSMHSLMVACTVGALIYAAVVAPWSEPLLYVTIAALFVAYYFYGGVLEMRVYRNDSITHQRLLAEIKCLSDGCAYRPTPYLLNANLQTLFAATGRPTPNVRFVRELVADVYPDGELCRLDWSMAPERPPTAAHHGGSSPAPPPPVVIVFHGLTGGSDDSNMHYITQTINQTLGWHVVIPVRRGCGDEATMTVPKFYAYGGVEDTEHVVDYIAAKMADHVLFGVGISAGSNILANYLGTFGNRSRISGAISIANGYCWDKGTRAIQDHHPVWDAIMSGIVHHTLFRRHRAFHEALVVTPPPPPEEVTAAGAAAAAAAGVASSPPLSSAASGTASFAASSPSSSAILVLKRVGSQREMDEAVSRRLHGFESLEAFYRHQSCEYRLSNIAVPTIFLNALDDPLAHHGNIPTELLGRNPHTLLVTTACGGHLGWAEGWWPFRNRATWMDRFIVEALGSLQRLADERLAGQCATRRSAWRVMTQHYHCSGGTPTVGMPTWRGAGATGDTGGSHYQGGGASVTPPHHHVDDAAAVTPRTTPAGHVSDADSASSSRRGCGDVDSLQASLNSPPRHGATGADRQEQQSRTGGSSATQRAAPGKYNGTTKYNVRCAATTPPANDMPSWLRTSAGAPTVAPTPSLRRNSSTSFVFGSTTSDTAVASSPSDASPKLPPSTTSSPSSKQRRDDATTKKNGSSTPSLYAGGGSAFRVSSQSLLFDDDRALLHRASPAAAL